MLTADFDYSLPNDLIAQAPTPERDQSRLLVLDRTTGDTSHKMFRDVCEYLRPGDLLVLNDTRVVPARLTGKKAGSGGCIEILLLEQNTTNDWWVMLRPGKRVRTGTQIDLADSSGKKTSIHATVLEKNAEGHCRLAFSGVSDIRQTLDQLGKVPLPPYISRAAGADGTNDRERYQTVFARVAGSVAAPTAGLHFTDSLLSILGRLGVGIHFVTLHVGLGTFAPVKARRVEGHSMHQEWFHLSAATAQAIRETKRNGRRVIAVGTTTVRVLESVAAANAGQIIGAEGRTRIFIYPPYQFRVVDALLTNFHLPQSTLLMLVSAFAAPNATHGRETILSAYAEAVRKRYRFFSYGDAMLIL